MAVDAVPGTAGERLLATVAERLLATATQHRELAGGHAAGLGDTVTALESAAALSALSPLPGQLAGLCQRLGVERHGIAAAPAADLPEPWTSVLVHYARRNRPVPRNGAATLATVLPAVDGVRFTLAGLRSGRDGSVLHVIARGLPAPRRDVPLRTGWDIGYSWWLRDDAGHWHLAVAEGFDESGTGDIALRLRLLPPLGRDATALDVVVTGPSARVRARVPLDWWAAP